MFVGIKTYWPISIETLHEIANILTVSANCQLSRCQVGVGILNQLYIH